MQANPTLQKLTKARASLVLAHPFFGALAYKLRFEVCPAIPTADVDGVTMRINPDFADKLTVPELAGVLAHEVMHCALGHCWRIVGREPERWNDAADYATNPLLFAASITLPKDALLDPQFANLSADEIYSRLPDDGGKDGPGRFGGVRPPPGDAPGKPAQPADIAQLEADWKVATIQAASAAKAQGMLPAGLERLVDTIKAPVIDWRAVLRRFIMASVPSDYAMVPPDRRFLGSGLYLPSLAAESVGPIMLAVDTSGSIGADELATFAAELNAILADAAPERVHVVYCDARINGTAEYAPQDFPVQLRALGGGGTDFRPPFAWCDERAILPVCAIYLTDLCGTFPDDPGYPVLWVSTGHDAAPFGEVIMLQESPS